MTSSKPHDISLALQDIAQSLENAAIHGIRCHIPYALYSLWKEESLPILTHNKLLVKERSKRLETISCFCGAGERLKIEYEEGNGKPFAQCFTCADIRFLMFAELEYYDITPLRLATYYTRCLEDIDKPKTLVKDRVFFVGETASDVLVYLVIGIETKDKMELLNACAKDAGGGVFIVLSTSEPLGIPKKYTLIPIYQRKLYGIEGKSLSLQLSYIESFCIKNAAKQEAANAKHTIDPRIRQKQKLEGYIKTNIDQWPLLTHEEIHQNICENPAHYEYETKAGEVKKLSDKTILTVIKAVLTNRNQRFRITGTSEYNSDKHTWYHT